MLSKKLLVALMLIALVAVTVQFARAGASSSFIDAVETDTSNARFETPSENWVTLTTENINVEGTSMLLVTLAGDAFVQDRNPQGNFVGRKYAAMKARVRVDDVTASPGPVTFTDNSGKVGTQRSRSEARSFQWLFPASAGAHEVEVQVRSLNAFDLVGLKRYTTSVIFDSV